MSFNCDICVVSFTTEANYQRHLSSKKHNKLKNSEEKMHVCTICNRPYLYKQSLSQHKKKCKNSNDVIQTQCTEIEKLNKEKEEMQKKINELTEKCGQTTNIGTQNINITINAFGNENLDYITKNDCKRIVSRVFFSAVEAAKLIYFNKDHPENHTVKIPNKKYPHALIMGKDNKWEMVNRAETIQKMASKSCNVVGDSFDRIYNEISGFQKARMQDFFHKMDMRDEEVMKQIEKEIDSNTLAYTRGSS